MRALSWKLLAFAVVASLMISLLPYAMPAQGQTQHNGGPAVEPPPAELKLTNAVMCEKVEDNVPISPAITFSVSTGQVCCFTSFDPVSQPTLIYQRWFHRDELSTQIRLRLYPPKWATYSQIQLRETDKGPWRVEISDQNGHVFDVIRFSITD